MRKVSHFRLVHRDIKTTHISVCVCVCVRATDNEAACECSVFTLINYINTVRQLFRL